MKRPPFVISIQSQVVFGHVGNSAALFPMQAAGLEVAAIPTVVFSNTPDYPTLRGRALPPEFFSDLPIVRCAASGLLRRSFATGCERRLQPGLEDRASSRARSTKTLKAASGFRRLG